MVQVYYYKEDDTPMTAPHDSGVHLSTDVLASIGVFYSNLPTLEQVNKLANDRNYQNRDEINLSLETFPGGEIALNEKLNIFFKEHLHEDEEIRYILQGEGYFDVRDSNDKWIRIKVQQNDMLILPAGIYHRFTLTDKMSVKALRLFKDEPVWFALNRQDSIADETLSRRAYLSQISS